MVPTDPHDSGTGARYRFDDIVVDAAAHTLVRAGEPQPVEPKAFAVLLALLQRPGELIGRDDLLDAVWGHRHVTPGVLTRAIAQLRHALDDDSQKPRYIQTQHAVGYRFVGELESGPVAIAETKMPSAATSADVGAMPLAGHREADDARLQVQSHSVVVEQGAKVMPVRPWPLRNWAVAALLAGVLAAASWVWNERSAVTPKPADASIAILPFTTLSKSRSDDYFAEGLAVELHDALAGVPGLKVAARMAPGAIARDVDDITALGRRLGVATVLDASVRRDGTRLRINARLSDCVSGYTLWSRTYDRQLSDVFATQSEIADEVLHALMEVLPETQSAVTRRLTPTRNITAFDFYLRGLQQLLRKGEKNSEKRASSFFSQALAVEPGFARAQAGICLLEVYRFEHERVTNAFKRASDACAKAKALDPELSEVNLALAKLHHARGDLGRASEYYAKAEADPARRPAVYLGLALLHGEQGRHRQALEHLQLAYEISPGDPSVHATSGYYSYLSGDIRGAIASYSKAVELQPENADLWSTLGALHVNAGDNVEGAHALEKSIDVNPTYAALSNLGELRYQAGSYSAAAALYRRAIALEPSDYILWGNLGNALLADPKTRGEAIAAYEQAAELAQRYLRIKSNDGTALAALAWFRANLGQAGEARELVRRSETLRGDPMEVPLFNALTFAVLGDMQQARQRVAAARAAGISDARISTNVVLRRAGLTPVAGAKDNLSPAPVPRGTH